MKNWKTTIIGALTGGTISLDAFIRLGFSEGWHQAIIGLAIAILGYVAADGKKQKTNDDGNGGSSNPGGPGRP